MLKQVNIKLNTKGIINKDNEPNININNNQVLLCMRWIKENKQKSQKIITNRTSYNYKHIVEDYFDEYISNGAFIYAALKLGYDIKSNGLNAYFNMKKK